MSTVVWATFAAVLLTVITLGVAILFATSPKARKHLMTAVQWLELLEFLQFLG